MDFHGDVTRGLRRYQGGRNLEEFPVAMKLDNAGAPRKLVRYNRAAWSRAGSYSFPTISGGGRVVVTSLTPLGVSYLCVLHADLYGGR